MCQLPLAPSGKGKCSHEETASQVAELMPSSTYSSQEMLADLSTTHQPPGTTIPPTHHIDSNRFLCSYPHSNPLQPQAMRYLDWDVLLFPDDSKIPIQEFKTGCFITADPGPSPLLSHRNSPIRLTTTTHAKTRLHHPLLHPPPILSSDPQHQRHLPNPTSPPSPYSNVFCPCSSSRDSLPSQST